MGAVADACRHYRGDSTRAVRLLVVDDHVGVREALVEFLGGAGDITVVGECEDGSEVVAAADRLRPDVVLMDLTMAGMDGLSATRALLAAQPDARVVVLTSRGDEARPAALDAGARGFVSKSADPAMLLRCIRSVVAGCSCCLDEAADA
ncbi:response regulator transcription factor [Geodermatophilus sabuli]|uniref:Response regulator transcription factor n=1 Tax=Geodermatophilus sabuli TaxID=1564158 RepID=A0A7K3W4U3_9ACTN|nr:response regulator transcription factor [Geodermatophilus sabuli]NEK59896.1 response regulator transcription factor [Geodermatophilus sabuli]